MFSICKFYWNVLFISCYLMCKLREASMQMRQMQWIVSYIFHFAGRTYVNACIRHGNWHSKTRMKIWNDCIYSNLCQWCIYEIIQYSCCCCFFLLKIKKNNNFTFAIPSQWSFVWCVGTKCKQDVWMYFCGGEIDRIG